MGFQIIRRAAVVAGVAAAVLHSSTLAAQAIVRGILYDDATGSPLRGTVMLVNPATDAPVVHTTTDSVGFFTLQTRDGLYQIGAIRPGYTAVLSAPVQLENGERLTIRVPIAEIGDPTHQIGVVERVRPDATVSKALGAAQRANSDVEGRRKSGTGLQYDRARLERVGVHTLGQFLQTVPGLSVWDPNSASTMEMARSAATNALALRGPTGAACHIGWFLDGHRVDIPGRPDPLTDGLGGLPLETIETVEVFRGVSEMPAEFAAPDLRCGAISVWTRRG